MVPFDDKAHNDYAAEIIEKIKEIGYLIGSRTYHDVFDSPMQKRLQALKTDFTCLGIRDDSDYLAVHKEYDKAFLFDIKTMSENRRERNMALNALPIARHITLWNLFHERCLYIFKDIPHDFECGFWIQDLPQPWCIKFPRELNSIDVKNGFRHELGDIFEETWLPTWMGGYTKWENLEKPTTVGSPDPFILSAYKTYSDYEKPLDIIRKYTYDEDGKD